LRRAGGRGESGTLTVKPVAGGLAPATATASVAVTLPPSTTPGGGDWDDVVAADVAVTIGTDEAPLWWPHGYGDQPLLDFDIVYTPDATPAATSTLTRRVGLRTVDLVRDPAPFEGTGPAPGEPSATFYFRVNGVPIFAKGGNYIPPSIFHSRAPGLVTGVMDAAAAAHMNMVRVWGGGAYPPDEFFAAADERGILVWQEFMAACALYPRDAPFLELCAKETRYQAARAGAYTCLAIWGGNNELEPSFTWFPEAKQNPRLYAVDYAALFVDTVRVAIHSVHPGVAFIDSSPTSGALSETPYVKWWGNPDSWYAGDVHFYDYESDPLDPAMYPRARFVSEFGFQSHPSFDAYAKVTAPDDWARDSEAVHYRQRHEGGNEEMDAQIARTFVLPPVAPPADWCANDAPTTLFRHWVYLTQVNQALAYETAIGLWRGLRSNPRVGTAGVLYWQLNDIWQGQSWSGLDADGTWRLLHHSARRFFAPLALWCDTRGGKLAVQAASDVRWPLDGEVTVDVIPWTATAADAVASIKAPFALADQESKNVFEAAWGDVLAGKSAQDVVIRVRATATGAAPDAVVFPVDRHRVLTSERAAAGETVQLAAEAVAFAARPRDARGVPVAPKLTFKVTAVDGPTATFTAASSAVALSVSLSSGDVVGTFSDGNFILLPWEPRELTFTRADGEAVDAAALEAALTAGSLSVGDTLIWGEDRAPGPKAGPPPGLEPTYDWMGQGIKTRAA
jgi:beta-galactosidase/beta-glucuronidase